VDENPVSYVAAFRLMHPEGAIGTLGSAERASGFFGAGIAPESHRYFDIHAAVLNASDQAGLGAEHIHRRVSEELKNPLDVRSFIAKLIRVLCDSSGT
jgi:hypothetical protein